MSIGLKLRPSVQKDGTLHLIDSRRGSSRCLQWIRTDFSRKGAKAPRVYGSAGAAQRVERRKWRVDEDRLRALVGSAVIKRVVG